MCVGLRVFYQQCPVEYQCAILSERGLRGREGEADGGVNGGGLIISATFRLAIAQPGGRETTPKPKLWPMNLACQLKVQVH